MKRFAKEYNGRAIEDAGAYKSDDFKSLARKFRNALKREFPDFEIPKYLVGHYGVSGFLKKDGVHIYFAWDVPRHGTSINTSDKGAMNGVLIRAAKHDSDYTGGENNFCSVEDMGKSVRALWERESSKLLSPMEEEMDR